MSKTAVIDADYILYAVASAGEKRSVKVVNKQTGDELEVDNRTVWYGNWRTKDGGKLAEINEKRDSPLLWDDFDYFDIQRPEPIENVLHSAKMMFESAYTQAGCSDYIGFLGGAKNFRNDVATILEYKGNRKDTIKPLLFNEVKDYLTRKFNLNIADGIEADDCCIIEAYGDPNKVVVAIDKDTGGNHVLWYNPNKPENGVVDCRGLGKLFLDSKGDVRGRGRMFFYLQVAFGDPVDRYLANSASDKKWGIKSAYKALVKCKTDVEALSVVKDIYQKLYPEPKVITGWREDDFEVDWKYVLNENWQLARMLRSYEELENPILATDVLEKMGIPV